MWLQLLTFRALQKNQKTTCESTKKINDIAITAGDNKLVISILAFS